MDHWERLCLRSWIVEEGEERLYQEGLLGQMLLPEELLAKRFDGSLPPGTFLFSGTPSVIGGVRSASSFRMELQDPVQNRSLRHRYQIETLPVTG